MLFNKNRFFVVAACAGMLMASTSSNASDTARYSTAVANEAYQTVRKLGFTANVLQALLIFSRMMKTGGENHATGVSFDDIIVRAALAGLSMAVTVPLTELTARLFGSLTERIACKPTDNTESHATGAAPYSTTTAKTVFKTIGILGLTASVIYRLASLYRAAEDGVVREGYYRFVGDGIVQDRHYWSTGWVWPITHGSSYTSRDPDIQACLRDADRVLKLRPASEASFIGMPLALVTDATWAALAAYFSGCIVERITHKSEDTAKEA